MDVLAMSAIALQAEVERLSVESAERETWALSLDAELQLMQSVIEDLQHELSTRTALVQSLEGERTAARERITELERVNDGLHSE